MIWWLCLDDRTSIQIETETREKLKELKITKLETYNEIINRLIKQHKKE